MNLKSLISKNRVIALLRIEKETLNSKDPFKCMLHPTMSNKPGPTS